MIEFNDFIKEVNKKFQDELWADFESKFSAISCKTPIR